MLASDAEWIQLFLVFLGPIQAFGCLFLALIMWKTSWPMGLRVALIAVNVPLAVACSYSGLAAARVNSGFRTVGFGGAGLELLAMVLMVLAAMKRGEQKT